MKYVLVTFALLFPPEAATRDRPAPARWSSKPDDRIPLPRLGVCPGGFEAWQWDGKRAVICVRRA